MDKKRVLVTGSNGMLGMDMVSSIGDLYDVYRTDLEEKKNFRHDGKKFLKCDITDGLATIRMIKELRPEVIIHTAAWTDVDGCELDQEKTMKINAEGTHNVALGAKEVNSILIYISSDFVFEMEGTMIDRFPHGNYDDAETTEVTDEQRQAAYDAGRQAYRDYVRYTECPHTSPELGEMWAEGWLEAEELAHPSVERET